MSLSSCSLCRKPGLARSAGAGLLVAWLVIGCRGADESPGSASGDGPAATPAVEATELPEAAPVPTEAQPAPPELRPDWTVDEIGTGKGTRAGPAGDVNGDGFDDFWVESRHGGSSGRDLAVRVYAGAPQGPGDLALTAIEAGEGRRLGEVLAAGDVNRDGFDDLAIGLPAGPDQSFVRLMHGGPDGLVAVGEDLVGPEHFGSTLAAGDVDGDGFSDLAVGSSWEEDERELELGLDREGRTGRVVIYRGSASGLVRTPAWERSGGWPVTRVGVSLALGDTNGDGFDDLVVTARTSETHGEHDRGLVEVHLGSPGGLSSTPAWGWRNRGVGPFGHRAATADVNGDGRDDVLVGAEVGPAMEGGGYTFFGSETGPRAEGAWRVDTPCGGNCFVDLASAGDVDGDGFDDLLLTLSQWQEGRLWRGGSRRLYLGGPEGPRPGLLLLEGPYCESSVDGLGDLDGDGFDEIALIPHWDGLDRVLIWRGSADGPALGERDP